MARGGLGKLAKLTCMIKRWRSRSSYHHRRLQSTMNDTTLDVGIVSPSLQPVYVGKSRRRYLVDSHLVEHPLFRMLTHRSTGGEYGGGGGDGDDKACIVVECEVVLFEHLLWILEDGDQLGQRECVDELAEFYICAC